MDKQKILDAIKKVKESSKERKFSQSIDLIINLKDFDIKKEAKVEEFLRLPNGRGKDATICALIGPEMKASAKICDEAVITDNFSKYSDSRKSRKLARKYDFFIGQATIMPQIAQAFGKYFGPIGKMPNPKGGQIVPPNANLEPIVNILKNTSKIIVSKVPVASCRIGDEKLDETKLAENIIFAIDHLEHALPRGKANIKNIIIKTTMGAPVRVE
ncbi:50S ribosomal protein L1 [Candidatus Woesearchaeota archaeon]|jgi:large subunit ribosomal protein L1|nr:50S ribosomal protein L1 [Candidatus Woesearchaeota archaeon]MBT4114369.1 50S ribosomal protein L1 [Candidatus Woesearchaeota archaeon]MBT4248566.1 50S ribosomal protein L1 [Candidatus Woesearchaeota archaeon]